MKSKKVKWIAIGLAALIVFSALTAGLIILAGKANNEAEYTYAAAAEKLPEYDTDLFNIDGKLDEEIYNRLRWWDESYAEGEMQDPVRVKATSYLGKNGVYFVFDVTDDKVYVNMKRASYNNSAVTVYVAAEGTHDLNDNVWEIDILPNNFINAKRYMGGYYYASVKAKGWENQPFVCTTTKGGDINTAECTGYIMESYFPYSYLFEDGKIPENINLNFALERSYSLESDSRDVYYNFGQNVISNWSWSDPGTWWVFNKNGLDSVDLVLETGEGGSFEYRNDYIARYQTEKIKITPDDGYRIKSLTMETNGTKEDVTDRITWEDGINYIKVRNATADVKLIAEFEKIPQSRFTLSGRVTLNGGALSNEVNSDIGLRFIGGGVAYPARLTAAVLTVLKFRWEKAYLRYTLRNISMLQSEFRLTLAETAKITYYSHPKITAKIVSHHLPMNRLWEIKKSFSTARVWQKAWLLLLHMILRLNITGKCLKRMEHPFPIRHSGNLTISIPQ